MPVRTAGLMVGALVALLIGGAPGLLLFAGLAVGAVVLARALRSHG